MLRESFECEPSSWYVQVVDAVSCSQSDHEDNLMDLVREELAQFYDVINEKGFNEIRKKYPSARMVLYQVGATNGP